MRVLLVEDDDTLGQAVRDHMLASGHAVDWMQSAGDAALAVTTVAYGLILLDLRLPDGNGIDILSRLRQMNNPVPVIILTAHDQISDRIEGLNAGADDYLVKPFNLDELTARMIAVSRRYNSNSAPVLRIGDLEIKIAERSILSAKGEIILSGREWAVLECLLHRTNAIVCKAQIEEALYAFGSEVESNTVEVYISRLRKKIGRDKVSTLRGVGYKIEGRT